MAYRRVPKVSHGRARLWDEGIKNVFIFCFQREDLNDRRVPKVSRGRARLWAEMERFYLLYPTRRSQWLTGVCQKYLTGGRDFGLR
jgi:hypothetical protein